ncbi:MAG: hypothetical protein UHE91_07250 [Bacteroidales bacterium]|nr:hypothetical protein [Bacteroidales bacterium]
MKIVAVEPIGISQERAKQLSEIYAQKGHQFVVYPDRKEDAPTLIERMQGAEGSNRFKHSFKKRSVARM